MNPVSGTEKKQFNLIGKGGSERRYFRISDGSGTGILLESPSSDPDFERYMQYSLFFHDNGIPVPDILSARCNPPVFIHDTQTGPFRYVLFEDLGDVPLYDFLKCHRSRTSIESIYKKIIDVLVLLHRKVSLHVSSCPLLSTRLFDYDHLRWETAYFLRSFVNDLLSISLSSKELLGLDLDFHMLANRVSKFKTTIVHRDFQSQNIMIDSASSPRLIDYQGARIGPPAYDVASLLWDPYYEIAGDIRDKLVDYYIDLSASTDVSFSAREFSSSLLPCRLQRHMQALGAYAFLALSKGKKYFTRFIPQAMAYLRQETEVTKDEYPQLHRLIERIREKA